MSVDKKEIVVSSLNLVGIAESLKKESVIGKDFDSVCYSLKKSKDWTEQASDSRNCRVLPSAYFFWNANREYTLVVPPKFNKPSPLEVRTSIKYLIDKNSKGLPDVQVLSRHQITERIYAGTGMVSQQVVNSKRCIFDPLVNLDILFKVTTDSGASIDQIVERFSDKKIGFTPSTVGFNFAELESPVYFNQRGKHKGYLIIQLRAGSEMKISMVYRPQV